MPPPVNLRRSKGVKVINRIGPAHINASNIHAIAEVPHSRVAAHVINRRTIVASDSQNFSNAPRFQRNDKCHDGSPNADP